MLHTCVCKSASLLLLGDRGQNHHQIQLQAETVVLKPPVKEATLNTTSYVEAVVKEEEEADSSPFQQKPKNNRGGRRKKNANEIKGVEDLINSIVDSPKKKQLTLAFQAYKDEVQRVHNGKDQEGCRKRKELAEEHERNLKALKKAHDEEVHEKDKIICTNNAKITSLQGNVDKYKIEIADLKEKEKTLTLDLSAEKRNARTVQRSNAQASNGNDKKSVERLPNKRSKSLGSNHMVTSLGNGIDNTGTRFSDIQ